MVRPRSAPVPTRPVVPTQRSVCTFSAHVDECREPLVHLRTEGS
jgi:hypothetical protein